MDITKKYGLTNRMHTMLFKGWMGKFKGCAPSNHQQSFLSFNLGIPRTQWEKFTMAEIFHHSPIYKREVTTFITSEHRIRKERTMYKELFFNK